MTAAASPAAAAPAQRPANASGDGEGSTGDGRGVVHPRTTGRDRGCGDPSAALGTVHAQSDLQAHATAATNPEPIVRKAQPSGPSPAPQH